MKCICGKESSTPYCPYCARPLESQDPKGCVLAYLRRGLRQAEFELKRAEIHTPEGRGLPRLKAKVERWSKMMNWAQMAEVPATE